MAKEIEYFVSRNKAEMKGLEEKALKVRRIVFRQGIDQMKEGVVFSVGKMIAKMPKDGGEEEIEKWRVETA